MQFRADVELTSLRPKKYIFTLFRLKLFFPNPIGKAVQSFTCTILMRCMM